MAEATMEPTHGTVRLPVKDVAWRGVQINKPLDEVKAAWSSANIPGNASFEKAPGDRGTNVSVEVDKDSNDDAEHRLSTYEGGDLDQRLESALWQFKGRLETGEVATTEGQSSGRSE